MDLGVLDTSHVLSFSFPQRSSFEEGGQDGEAEGGRPHICHSRDAFANGALTHTPLSSQSQRSLSKYFIPSFHGSQSQSLDVLSLLEAPPEAQPANGYIRGTWRPCNDSTTNICDTHLRLNYDRVLRERAEKARGQVHASGAEEDERDIAQSPRARDTDHDGRGGDSKGEGEAKERKDSAGFRRSEAYSRPSPEPPSRGWGDRSAQSSVSRQGESAIPVQRRSSNILPSLGLFRKFDQWHAGGVKGVDRGV